MLRVAIAQSEGTRTDAVLADVFAQCEAQLHGSMPQAGVLVASAEFDYQAGIGDRPECPGIACLPTGRRRRGSVLFVDNGAAAQGFAVHGGVHAIAV